MTSSRRRYSFIFGIACAVTLATTAAAATTVSSHRSHDAIRRAGALTALHGTVPGINTLNLPRVPWAGGSAYYRKFSAPRNFGWTSPKFFPIGIWWDVASNSTEIKYDKSLGINTYVITNPAMSYKLFDKNHVSYIGTRLNGQPRNDPAWVGDFLGDEIDGTSSSPAQGEAKLQAAVNALPDHHKIRYANFTGMVVSWLRGNPTWAAAAKKYVNDYTDVVSMDAYWFSTKQCLSRNPEGGGFMIPWKPNQCRTPQNYGRNVAQMIRQDATDHKRQPVWGFIEDAEGQPGISPMTPAEQKAAVISMLINGASGIIWFNNTFGGACPTSGGVVRTVEYDPSYPCARNIKAMGQINRLIGSLAPVLNSQSYRWTFGPGLETMLKTYNHSAYIFAMPTDDGAKPLGTRSFKLPAQLRGRTITVLGENRKIIPLANGTFTDKFSALTTYHIYKIS
ncbi:hypothetical protein [Flexivirga caeni]|uniref:Glycoside hydrolase family 42 N-terminal domain-containing protein n=1 Tax=Flexivirga caeni TaxID=2294115 RepID=A0A3M9M6L6_9MICO|nr:hypothetical protein [Flexivirga caeni]RNI21182.1 hypothetical protein EFY87_13000 [Flexivirga caeni]